MLKRKPECAACLKYSVLIFVEKNIYKMQHLEGSGTPVLYIGRTLLNLLAPEFYIYILAHPVCKMWIIQEPKKLALRNKRHFEEKTLECAACLKYSVLIIVEKIYKMQHLEGSGTPVLYIGRTLLNLLAPEFYIYILAHLYVKCE